MLRLLVRLFVISIVVALAACSGGSSSGGGGNQSPLAVNDLAQTNQAQAVIVSVLANDNDPDGSLNTSSVVVSSAPMNGTAVANADGTVTYTPNAAFAGPDDSFNYTVSDNQGAVSNAATVTVNFNARPVANNDVAQTNQGQAVIVNVLVNDNDPDGTLQNNSVAITVAASNGNAVANADGTVTYTPNAGFSGTSDSFGYTVSDNQSAVSNTATVTVNINLNPQAAAACQTTKQEVQFVGTLSATVTDPDNTPGGLVYSLNADGSGGSGPISTSKGQVRITNNLTGAFTYTPNAQPSRRGADTFQFRVEDTGGGSASATVTIIIDPRIMPLGDSVTQGIVNNFTPALATRVGYRQALYNALTTSGYAVDFVGARSIGAGVGGGFDADNEGYAGALAAEIATSGGMDQEPGVNAPFPDVIGMLNTNPADIVLLHVGTNDVNQGTAMASDVQTILTKINTWENSVNGNPVAVILAGIIDQCTNYPTDCGTGNPNVVTFNTNVFNLASTLTPATGPDEIFYVNQRNALLAGPNPDVTLYGNVLHPNQTGYNLMANVWLNKLTNLAGPAILQKCP